MTVGRHPWMDRPRAPSRYSKVLSKRPGPRVWLVKAPGRAGGPRIHPWTSGGSVQFPCSFQRIFRCMRIYPKHYYSPLSLVFYVNILFLANFRLVRLYSVIPACIIYHSRLNRLPDSHTTDHVVHNPILPTLKPRPRLGQLSPCTDCAIEQRPRIIYIRVGNIFAPWRWNIRRRHSHRGFRRQGHARPRHPTANRIRPFQHTRRHSSGLEREGRDSRRRRRDGLLDQHKRRLFGHERGVEPCVAGSHYSTSPDNG